MGRNKNVVEEIGFLSDEEVTSAFSANSQINNKGNKRVRDGENGDAVVAPKRPKIVWTSILHARFLQAINHIGMERAVPKKILEFMNVRGLTRENVASHLQKYRMFLKKVAEKGLLWSVYNMSDRLFRSSFATGYNPSLAPSVPLRFPQKPLAAFQFPSAAFPDSPPQLRHGQSSLLAAHSALQNPLYFRNLARNSIPSQQISPALMSFYQRNQFPPGPGFEFPLPSNYAGIVLNSNGELGTGQMLPFAGAGGGFAPNQAGLMASSVAKIGNYLGQGGLSSPPGNLQGNSGGFSLQFDAPDQETAAMFTPNLQKNVNVGVANSGGNSFDFSLFNDVPNHGVANPNVEQVLEDFDLDFLLNSTTSNQQQEVQGAANIEISNQTELNPNDFLNVEFSNSCAILDKAPMNEHCSQEIQSVEQAGNADSGGNGNSMGSFSPIFDQAQSSPEDQMDSDIADMIEAIGSSDKNQEWAENFMDLLGNNPK